MNAERVRVLCVEDNELVADAIQRKLERDGQFEWVGWVSTASDLMRLVVERSPHVVCMDLDVPGQDTVAMIKSLRASHPEVRVLVLSGHLRPEHVDATVNAGAWGYLSKAEESRVIVDSIRRVAAGEFVLGHRTRSEYPEFRPPARPGANGGAGAAEIRTAGAVRAPLSPRPPARRG